MKSFIFGKFIGNYDDSGSIGWNEGQERTTKNAKHKKWTGIFEEKKGRRQIKYRCFCSGLSVPNFPSKWSKFESISDDELVLLSGDFDLDASILVIDSIKQLEDIQINECFDVESMIGTQLFFKLFNQ